MNHSKTHFGGDGRKVGFRYRSARRGHVPNGTSNAFEWKCVGVKRDHHRLHPDQILFAFLIPTLLRGIQNQEQYLSDFWPYLTFKLPVFKDSGSTRCINVRRELLMNNLWIIKMVKSMKIMHIQSDYLFSWINPPGLFIHDEFHERHETYFKTRVSLLR